MCKHKFLLIRNRVTVMKVHGLNTFLVSLLRINFVEVTEDKFKFSKLPSKQLHVKKFRYGRTEKYQVITLMLGIS